MSYMNESTKVDSINQDSSDQTFIEKKADFITIYNKSYRLAAAVFMISNLMDRDEELRTKIKKLSLNMVSMSVNLKDISFYDAKKLMVEIEKNSLELMSMLDIASVSGLVSKMNAAVIKEEFQSFINELANFALKFESNKDVSVKNVFNNSLLSGEENLKLGSTNTHDKGDIHLLKNGNGQRRKDLRKNNILEFIKGHKNVNIKDIVPNIVGCSEKTIQRELLDLIAEGKIKKVGERRWSRYSIV